MAQLCFGDFSEGVWKPVSELRLCFGTQSSSSSEVVKVTSSSVFSEHPIRRQPIPVTYFFAKKYDTEIHRGSFCSEDLTHLLELGLAGPKGRDLRLHGGKVNKVLQRPAVTWSRSAARNDLRLPSRLHYQTEFYTWFVAETMAMVTVMMTEVNRE